MNIIKKETQKFHQQKFHKNCLKQTIFHPSLLCRSSKKSKKYDKSIFILRSLFITSSLIYFSVQCLNLVSGTGSKSPLSSYNVNSERPNSTTIGQDRAGSKPMSSSKTKSLITSEKIIISSPGLEYLNEINLQGDVVVTIMKDGRFILEKTGEIFVENKVGDFENAQFCSLNPQALTLGIWRDLNIFCSEIPDLETILPR